jgi:hypothetical protein
MKQRSIVALLIVALSSVLLASGSAAAKDENGDAKSGFVTSWDEAKIHYIEAGTSRLASRPKPLLPLVLHAVLRKEMSRPPTLKDQPRSCLCRVL